MMKLFVWEDVLTGWSSGMITAIACRMEDVYKLADAEGMSSLKRDIRTKPTSVTPLTGCTLKRAKLWYVYGGG